MEALIDGLKRASAASVVESEKTMATTSALWLDHLRIVMDGFLSHPLTQDADTLIGRNLMRAEPGAELTMQEFVGNLEAISRVADEPLASWLKKMAIVLTFLGKVLMAPHRAAPSPQQTTHRRLEQSGLMPPHRATPPQQATQFQFEQSKLIPPPARPQGRSQLSSFSIPAEESHKLPAPASNTVVKLESESNDHPSEKRKRKLGMKLALTRLRQLLTLRRPYRHPRVAVQ